ncbi:hypothetical protein Raf01_65210 [Rugosimonospora africana]|uniref:Uncharacterized protein n=1 Tax=Rugosimonospora africana TaxID=556532 RepID=A0A8J3QWD8_9ACTN|nr:hypothetical protein Raf01_65210 [Rugosimonospora africana]
MAGTHVSSRGQLRAGEGAQVSGQLTQKVTTTRRIAISHSDHLLWSWARHLPANIIAQSGGVVPEGRFPRRTASA